MQKHTLGKNGMKVSAIRLGFMGMSFTMSPIQQL